MSNPDKAELARLFENQRRKQRHEPGIPKPPPPPSEEEIENREYCDALARKILASELDPIRFRETIERGDRYNIK